MTTHAIYAGIQLVQRLQCAEHVIKILNVERIIQDGEVVEPSIRMDTCLFKRQSILGQIIVGMYLNTL